MGVDDFYLDFEASKGEFEPLGTDPFGRNVGYCFISITGLGCSLFWLKPRCEEGPGILKVNPDFL